MKIGFFDSGIGGLSVLHNALLHIPDADFIYYGDTDNVPYGEKSNEQIIGYVDGAVSFLQDKGACAVVIACNTATSAAIGFLREKYAFPIIGMEPAVKPAVANSNKKRILVLATPYTVNGDKLKKLLDMTDSGHLVDLCALPGLVRLAEKNIFTGREVMDYLYGVLAAFRLEAYSELVLGCTHFNYFKDSLKLLCPGAQIIDGCTGTVNRLMDLTKGISRGGNGHVDYYCSGRPVCGSQELERLRGLLARLDEMARL